MTIPCPPIGRLLPTLLACLFVLAGCSTPPPPVPAPKPAPTPGARGAAAPIIYRTNYHGWKDSIVMSGGGVELIIVPSIGRIMQFRFAGEAGIFWENEKLHGKVHPEKPFDWLNFGGDKSWPAPESDWPKRTNGFWLPPIAFDSKPVTALIGSHGVTLVAPLDTNYQIRATREIELGPAPGSFRVETRYEKVAGDRTPVSVWTITQLQEPLGVFVPIRPDSRFAEGFRPLSQNPPPSLRTNQGLISLTRSPRLAYKIGSDANRLVWVGPNAALLMETHIVPGAEYPDGGSVTEVYTNPDPLPYVELEMLSPLRGLRDGDSYSLNVTYQLFRREESTPLAEAQRILETPAKKP